ncbi:MAG: hypothetical protein KBS65_00015 [Prevotella sp.]|nr:hypothetical protein [Candidatus Equicola stercoris]
MATKNVINPAEMSVEEKLKALYELQQTLTAIDEKRALRGELPLEVQDLEDEVEGLKTRMEKINDEVKEINNAIAQKNIEVAKATDNVERYKKQLNDVKNNREYDTLSKEIEFQSLEIELAQKKIREGNKKLELKQEDINKAQEAFDERQKDLETKRKELDEIMEETRAEEDVLKRKAAELEKKIEARLLTSFKRIRKNARNGLGVVPVQRDACGGCFAQIPPQRQLDIKSHKKIIVCEYCGRILVDQELAGIKEDTQVKKPKRTVKKLAEPKVAPIAPDAKEADMPFEDEM